MWQQLIEFLNGMRWGAGEHIAEPGERIEFIQLAGSYKTAQDGHGLSAAVAAQESPVPAANGYAAQRTFRSVIVDRQVPIFEIAGESKPVLQHVRYGLAGLAFGK